MEDISESVAVSIDRTYIGIYIVAVPRQGHLPMVQRSSDRSTDVNYVLFCF